VLTNVAYRPDNPDGIGDVRRLFGGKILLAEDPLSFEVYQGAVST
jgi:hypothetical protein